MQVHIFRIFGHFGAFCETRSQWNNGATPTISRTLFKLEFALAQGADPDPPTQILDSAADKRHQNKFGHWLFLVQHFTVLLLFTYE